MQVFGVSFDSPEDNRAFAQKNAFDFPLLSDTDRSLALAVGACDRATDAYPRRVTYVIGTTGLVEQAIETADPGGQANSLVESTCSL